ncbi:60S ribosomal protein L13-1-like protein [Tanacetum coccineum]
MVISRSTGKTMSGLGLTSMLAKPGEEMVSTCYTSTVKDFPKPAGKLHPQVPGQTLKYHMKLREGRGFSLEE